MQQKYTYLERGGVIFHSEEEKRILDKPSMVFIHKETDYTEPELITTIAQKRTDPGFYNI